MSDFYIYLTTSGEKELESSEKAKISYRLRDVLMKEWTLVGIPSVIAALVSLAKVEGDIEMVNKELSTKWFGSLHKTDGFSLTCRLQERSQARCRALGSRNEIYANYL